MPVIPMKYRKKTYNRITIKIQPQMEFKKILDTLEDITLPEMGSKQQNLKYAVLEMVNNSIRVHREHEINEPIHITIDHRGATLTIEVRDFGPGFDPEILPYSLNDDPEEIDLKSQAFLEYRERNNYLRFGMGLYVVRKTFPVFELTFLNEEGHTIQWEPGKVSGTSIIVGFQKEKGADGT
jgi:light-regulated signal transduction histidine kinase (bacteriophytochrome)